MKKLTLAQMQEALRAVEEKLRTEGASSPHRRVLDTTAQKLRDGIENKKDSDRRKALRGQGE